MESPHSTESSVPELEHLIRARLQSRDGWIGFDEFMALALYAPGLGYYSGPARKFGARGDFVTAPEISPMFGACLASQIAAWMTAAGIDHLLEFGAGTGQLASQVLNELERLGQSPARYSILELSANLQDQQRATLGALSPQSLSKVEWLGTMPEALKAIVLANEVLDAMPVSLFHWDGEQLFERGVALAGSEAANAPPGDPAARTTAQADCGVFCWRDRPASPAFRKEVLQSLKAAGYEDLAILPAPFISEIHLQGKAWIGTLAKHLACGAILTLDYGFPAREYFHGQRDRGTLACHFRHRVSFDPFEHIGLQDLTAHVDFTGINDAAGGAGLQLAGFCSQARFLMNTGLLDRLRLQPMDQTMAYASQAQAVGKLLSEAEMGELFKAIAWVKAPDEAGLRALQEATFAFEPGSRAL